MSIDITAVQLSGGNDHEYIIRLRWRERGAQATGENTRADIVDFIERDRGEVFTDNGQGGRAEVFVVTPAHGPKYLRTAADGQWTNNLLALPRW